MKTFFPFAFLFLSLLLTLWSGCKEPDTTPTKTLYPTYGEILPQDAIDEITFTWPDEQIPPGDGQKVFELYRLDSVATIFNSRYRYYLSLVTQQKVTKANEFTLNTVDSIVLNPQSSYIWQLVRLQRDGCRRVMNYSAFSIGEKSPLITNDSSPFSNLTESKISAASVPTIDHTPANVIGIIHIINGSLLLGDFVLFSNQNATGEPCLKPDVNDSLFLRAELNIEIPCDSLYLINETDSLAAFVFDSYQNSVVSANYQYSLGENPSFDNNDTYVAEIEDSDYVELQTSDCERICHTKLTFAISFKTTNDPNAKYYFGAYLSTSTEHNEIEHANSDHVDPIPFEEVDNFLEFESMKNAKNVDGTDAHLQDHILLLEIPICEEVSS